MKSRHRKISRYQSSPPEDPSLALLGLPEVREAVRTLVTDAQLPQAIIFATREPDGGCRCRLLLSNDGIHADKDENCVFASSDMDAALLEGCLRAAEWGKLHQTRVVINLPSKSLIEKFSQQFDREFTEETHQEVWGELLALRQWFGVLTFEAPMEGPIRVMIGLEGGGIIYTRPPHKLIQFRERSSRGGAPGRIPGAATQVSKVSEEA